MLIKSKKLDNYPPGKNPIPCSSQILPPLIRQKIIDDGQGESSKAVLPLLGFWKAELISFPLPLVRIFLNPPRNKVVATPLGWVIVSDNSTNLIWVLFVTKSQPRCYVWCKYELSQKNNFLCKKWQSIFSVTIFNFWFLNLI